MIFRLVAPPLGLIVAGLTANSFASSAKLGIEGVVGSTGTVVKSLDPEGRIRLGPEYWTARSLDGQPIPAGEAVVVRAVDGLVAGVVRAA
jgi:membrane protein implicated in regulation of membrane protease activity